jgi:hypothetical protein
MADLFAYTDGACSGNPGPGGWGVLLLAREGGAVIKERTLQGGEADTTNNRMELMAAISALEALTKPSDLPSSPILPMLKMASRNGSTGGSVRIGAQRADRP